MFISVFQLHISIHQRGALVGRTPVNYKVSRFGLKTMEVTLFHDINSTCTKVAPISQITFY